MDWYGKVFGNRGQNGVAIARVMHGGKLRGFWCLDYQLNTHQVSIDDKDRLSRMINLDYDANGLICTSNSLDGIYAVDELTGKIEGREITVLHVKESMTGNGKVFTVCDPNGNVTEVGEKILIALAERKGGVNFKVVSRGGLKFISPIKQWFSKELVEGKVWTKEEILMIKDKMGTRALNNAKYLYRRAKKKKSVERYKLIFKYRMPSRENMKSFEVSHYPEVKGSLVSKIHELRGLVRSSRVHPRTEKHYGKTIQGLRDGNVYQQELEARIFTDYLNYSVINVCNKVTKSGGADMLVKAHSEIKNAENKKAATYITAMYADFVQLRRNSDGKVSNTFPFIYKGLLYRVDKLVENNELPKIYTRILVDIEKG